MKTKNKTQKRYERAVKAWKKKEPKGGDNYAYEQWLETKPVEPDTITSR